MDPRDIPLQVLRDLWLVRFGEDCPWDTATAHYKQDKFVGEWYRALSNAGLLNAYLAEGGSLAGLRIRVVEQEEICSGKQAPK